MIDLIEILPKADSNATKPALESYNTLNGNFAYYSNAITSGKEYFNRCKKGIEIDYPNLISFNLNKSRKGISKLKQQLPNNCLLINPSEFTVKGWNQDTYNYLWGTLIQNKINTIFLSKDWEYSKGATFECLWAIYHGKQVYNEDMSTVDKEQALNKIKKAIKEYQKINISTEFQEKLLEVFQ